MLRTALLSTRNGLTVYNAQKYDVKIAKIEIHGSVIKQVSDFISL